MSQESERIAVLETEHKNMSEDMRVLFKFQREHMEKEDLRWEEIQGHMVKQKTFVGSVIFITSALWAGGMALAAVVKAVAKGSGT